MRDALLSLAAGLAAFVVCIATPAYFVAEYVEHADRVTTVAP